MANVFGGKPTLIMLCGAPASGKSSYAKAFTTIHQDVKYVSRDEIRFSLVNENESYFSKEEEVFQNFVDKINEYLEAGYDVIADATNNTRGSRRKLLNQIKNIDNIHIVPVNFEIPLQQLVKWNNNRSGREKAPIDVLTNMWERHESPTFGEAYTYLKIVNVRPGGRVDEMR